MRKIISAVLIAATLVSCLASCKPAGSSDETQSEEYTTSYEPDIKKPKNPDKTLFQKTQEEYEDGNLGCTGLTLLAKYNKGVAYNINSYKDEENKIYCTNNQKPYKVRLVCAFCYVLIFIIHLKILDLISTLRKGQF